MPQHQTHRGQHPEDARLFDPSQHPLLRAGVADYSFLLTRGYSNDAALKLVGDRYQLDVRQRRALLRAACSEESLQRRAAHCIPLEKLRGEPLIVDGYNLLITAESILAGGVLIRGRDGCVRDMASIHGSYRRVVETLPAIALLGRILTGLAPHSVRWVFDAPVSNSARLRALMLAEALRHGWPWEVELDTGVDPRLAAAEEIVITSDGWILDRAARWANLADRLVEAEQAQPRLIRLDDSAPDY
ncbi:MAG: DUF434 domain-containing protein [FCB group bacterium]|jgi:hypothetical protein|nr:DUF434 domain-containing protein [FCB group bacterium]